MEKEKMRIAVDQASACLSFYPDDEDEQIADDPISCFNCRYRRWIDQTEFSCLKQAPT